MYPILQELLAPLSHDALVKKPVVIGLYGVPGSGKTFLLRELQKQLNEGTTANKFEFYEGSEIISQLVPGGLMAFKALGEQERTEWRKRAIHDIQMACLKAGKTGVVAGHYMFWPEVDEYGTIAMTHKDLEVFTHILYLNADSQEVLSRRRKDTQRSRPSTSVDHLHEWQNIERVHLNQLCRTHGLLFSSISTPNFDVVKNFVADFHVHSEEYNLSLAKEQLRGIMSECPPQLETVMVVDADKTLAADDTGDSFWRCLGSKQPMHGKEPLKSLFSCPLGYSYAAFRQAMLLYEDATDDMEFDTTCGEVAAGVTMYPEFVALLQSVSDTNHVRAVVVTSGLRCVWEKVIKNCLGEHSGRVKVLGGGRLADGFVVTSAVKAALVTEIQYNFGKHVWAFGDSVLDMDMLCRADEAVVVVGKERNRSKSMESALARYIEDFGLEARQVLLPSNVSPRLNTSSLPLVELAEPDFRDSILCHHGPRKLPQIRHATDSNAARLLTTPTRDAAIAGPVLREAHRRAGWYLAVEILSGLLTTEKYPIVHVQGAVTDGYRIFQESKTCIVPLMRGGEPLALGVSDALPQAMFVHAKSPKDLKPHHLQGQQTLLLVDWVVNTGKSVVQFLEHVRSLNVSIRIVVIAGVTQEDATLQGKFAKALVRDDNFSLVTLRLSRNKYTGKGTTDTGNRLFNTTHLD